MDPSLIVHKFHPFVEKQPLNVHYQEYTADTSNKQVINWNIDSPFAGALLDNEVWVEWTMDINVDENGVIQGVLNGLGTQFADVGATVGPIFAALDRPKCALAQGFPVCASLANIELVVNGQSLRQSPWRYAQMFTRFYGHPMETEGLMSLSGGELDQGSHGAMSAGGFIENQTLLNKSVAAGVDSLLGNHLWSIGADVVTDANFLNASITMPPFAYNWVNTGYDKRLNRLHEKLRWNSTATLHSDGANGTLGDMNFVGGRRVQIPLFERVPLSPFLFLEAKDGKRSIPYVDKMELTFQFHSNANNHIFDSEPEFPLVVADGLDFVQFHTQPPKLHLRWYIPPPGMVMEPEISIPVSVYKESAVSISLPDLAGNQAVRTVRATPPSTENVSFLNLRLQQIPDMMFIYCKKNAAAVRKQDCAEHHLGIRRAEITINGDSGKMLRASSGELFAMYVRNSPMAKERIHSYEAWRKWYCVLALTPADLGVRVPPGVNHGVTLDVRLEVNRYWDGARIRGCTTIAPEVGRTAGLVTFRRDQDGTNSYILQIIGVYDKYELTLTNRGNAQLKLQNVPSLDLPQQVAPVDQADLRAQFA